jgi:cell division protein FtsQ
MDPTRRGGANRTPARGTDVGVPARSRLVVRPATNRRKASAAPRLTRRAIADACGRALRRSVPALVAGAVVAAVGVGLWAGHRYVTSSPRFAVATIDVRGTARLTADDVRALLRVRPGDNVFAADLRAEAAALEGEPWILAAEVRRELPDTIVVEVEERTAAAVVALDALYYADAGGVPFRRCDEDYAAELPLVTGLERDAFAAGNPAGAAAVRAALATIATWRAVPTRPVVDEIHVDGKGGLALRTEDGVSIQLGTDPDGIAARLRRFDLAWSHLGEDERARARTIHLDHETRQDHVIVAFKD